MGSTARRGAALFVSAIFLVLFAALLFLLEVKPPGELHSIEGVISSQTPINNKGKLSGFRFCVGNPVMTFTYLDPDPRVESVWPVIAGSKRVRVHYASHTSRNPTLWGLEADGRTLATVSELESARASRFLLLLAGVCASGVVALVATFSWLKAKRRSR
jgi:hypothetical protein